MPNQWDLTGENIENTYQRVLQTPDGVNIYDGTGSLFTVTAVAAPAGPSQSIQFNDNGVTSGSSNFLFDKTNNLASLSGSLIVSDSIYFTGSQATGRLTWNDVDGTLELGLKGGVVKSELGQGLITRVVNKTVPNIDLLGANYQVVVVAGAQGQRLAVKLAQANNDANSAGTLGLVAEDILKNQEGFIVTVGLLKNINTTGSNGETWNDGDILYLSPTIAGQITNIKPQAPNHTVIVGYVEYAHQNNGKIYVKIDNGYELDELHNVRITTSSLTSGDMLVYSSSVWVNTKQLTGSYGLTGSLTTSGSNTFIGNQVVSGSFIIDVSSSTDALRITQRGSGNAIIVEDQASDTSPFVVDAAGRIGIGTSSPQYFLVASSSAATDTVMYFDGGTAANSNIVAAADTTVKIPSLVLWDRTAGAYSTGVAAYIGIDRSSSGVPPVFANRNDMIYVNNFLNAGHYFVTNNGGAKAVRMVISGSGNVGIGIAAPQYKLDVSGSARVTSSLYLPGLTTTAQNNVVTVDISTGQLYYTASSAFGGGSSTPTFPYTGSAIISGSLTVTGSFYVSNSIDSENRYLYNAAGNIPLDWQTQYLYDAVSVVSLKWNDRTLEDSSGNTSINWETRRLATATVDRSAFEYSDDIVTSAQTYHKQESRINVEGEEFSSAYLKYSGQAFIYPGKVNGGCVVGNLIYLKNDGIWYPVDQSTVSSTQMLGIYLDSNLVLLEGDVVLDNINNMQSPSPGQPIYIRDSTTTGTMSSNSPIRDYIRIIGYCYYNNVNTNTSYWILKFRPSTDWYKI